MTDPRSRAEHDRDAEIALRASRPSGAGPADGRVDADEMQRRLGLASRYMAKRVLVGLGADGSAGLDTDALVDQLRKLAAGTPDTKLRFAFALHDENGDGVIDRGELERLMHLALAENRLELGDGIADALVDAMMTKADLDGDGRISWDEWRASLESFPGVLETITLGDLHRLGLGPATENEAAARTADARTWTDRALRTNGLTWLLFGVYLAANVALFVEAWLRYEARGAPVLVQLARACGACLNLHAAIVLLPMLRRTLTLVGRTALGRVLIDDHVGFHRVVGSAALYLAIGHAVAHVANYLASGVGVAAGLTTWAGATGAILLAVHLALWGFARSPVRRRAGRFELFAITHRLYPLWIGVLLVHGPVAWMWMLVPVTVYAVDRLFGRRVHRARIAGLDALPAGTTRVRIARPQELAHRAADYVFARVPVLSRVEWHPFTISSAPDAPELILHVRAVGDWTRELRDLAEHGARDLAIELDGPYGTPTTAALDARHVLLVAAGIGVTPFASVIAALRAGAASRCEHVHFVWVCREQHAFSWFTDLLGEAEIALGDRLTVSIYMDSGRRDAQSTVLSVAMDALYAHTRSDLVTGLRARTTLGAPDWDALLASAAARHRPDPVTCFFCGPDGLARVVRAGCARHGLVFRQEHF